MPPRLPSNRARAREILETAAGTGGRAREIAERLSVNVRIVMTNLNVPMLNQAGARRPDGDRILWQQTDALALLFED